MQQREVWFKIYFLVNRVWCATFFWNWRRMTKNIDAFANFYINQKWWEPIFYPDTPYLIVYPVREDVLTTTLPGVKHKEYQFQPVGGLTHSLVPVHQLAYISPISLVWHPYCVPSSRVHSLLASSHNLDVYTSVLNPFSLSLVHHKFLRHPFPPTNSTFVPIFGGQTSLTPSSPSSPFFCPRSSRPLPAVFPIAIPVTTPPSYPSHTIVRSPPYTPPLTPAFSTSPLVPPSNLPLSSSSPERTTLIFNRSQPWPHDLHLDLNNIHPTLSPRFLPSPSRRLATPALPSSRRSLPHPHISPSPSSSTPVLNSRPRLNLHLRCPRPPRVIYPIWTEKGWQGGERGGCYRKRRILPDKCEWKNKQTCAVSTLALICENCVITIVLKPEAPIKMSTASVECVIFRTNQTTWITSHVYYQS